MQEVKEKIERPKVGQFYIPLRKQTVNSRNRLLTPVWRVTVILKQNVFAREVYGGNDAVISFKELEGDYAIVKVSELYLPEELTIMSDAEIKRIVDIFGPEVLKRKPEKRFLASCAKIPYATIPKLPWWKKLAQYLKTAF